MDVNSTYKGRPSLLWAVVLIVAAVGIYYLAWGFGYFFDIIHLNIDTSGVSDEVAKLVNDIGNATVGGAYIFLGIMTLLIAFLLYSGSNGGKVVFIIILVISILGNAFGLLAGDLTSIVFLALALICFVLLYQPPVKAYFKR